MNQQAKYLGQSSFSSNVICRDTHIHWDWLLYSKHRSGR